MENKHHGPHPGILAAIFMILFITGLSFVVSLSGTPPYFPGPWETQSALEGYFQHHAHDVMLCAFFQFASAVPLALLAMAMSSRLRWLGTQSTGPYIALAGGLLTAVNVIVSSLL